MRALNTIIYHIFLVLTLVVVMGSCHDDYYGWEADASVTGETDVTLNLAYGDYATTLSRATAGDAVETISNVCVLVYGAADSLLVDKVYAHAGAGLELNNNRASLTLRLPYGRYRMYAVANMGDMSDHAADIQTERGMRAITCAWDPTDISANNLMCGVVTESADNPVVNRQAPTMYIGRDTRSLHSWLTRTVSKVTVAYDATRLSESIKIYVISAQLRDIPRTSTLVDKNIPTDALHLTDGETISYLADGTDYTSSRVVLASGSGYGALTNVESLDQAHTATEESLYMFENMQGQHEGKHQYGADGGRVKEDVPYGTYLEVKAYYHNRSQTNPSHGPITYRYMLGMDDVKDYNAIRNTHFRVTLVFNGDANTPDWHIEYKLPGPPAIEVPSPMYISYLYNRELQLPVVTYYDKDQHQLQWIKAEIVENPHTYSGHPYEWTAGSYSGVSYNWQDNRYGFLSFGRKTETTINVSDASNYLSSITVDNFDLSAHDGAKMTINVPVYTRPLNLRTNVGSPGFSGNNPFTHRERIARLRITAKFRNLTNLSVTETRDIEVEVVQAKRVVNPKGCWREAGSTKPFTFTLMEADGDATDISSIDNSRMTYTPIRSSGVWTARIYRYTYEGNTIVADGDDDWIQLKACGTNVWSTGSEAQVTGKTNSIVEFDFRPAGTTTDSKPRFGVIEVLYHDNRCAHLIMVSQGFGAVNVGDRKWMMGNLYGNGIEVDNPLMEGSMFKYGTARYAIKSTNNYTMDDEYKGAGPFADANNVSLDLVDSQYSSGSYTVGATKKKFGAIASDNTNGFSNAGLKYRKDHSGTYHVARYSDYQALLNPERFGTLFGVLYGQEMSATATTDVDRYTTAGDKSGMRGCFVFDRKTANHLFLPIGATGIGRRKVSDGSKKGVLKYANREAEMTSAQGAYMPLLYDLYRKPGALYWFEKITDVSGTKHYALDINYNTYLIETLQSKITYDYTSSNVPAGWEKSNSDAAFVRRIMD